MKDLKQFIVLPLICAVVATLLAVSNSFTAPIISERIEAEANAAAFTLIPTATGFTTAEIPAEILSSYRANYIKKSDSGEGVVIELLSGGYGGDIQMLVALDTAGAVIDISIIAHTETPSVGTRALTPEFLSQFSGKSGELDGAITFVSGATVTSEAVTKGVQNAIDLYTQVGGII